MTTKSKSSLLVLLLFVFANDQYDLVITAIRVNNIF